MEIKLKHKCSKCAIITQQTSLVNTITCLQCGQIDSISKKDIAIFNNTKYLVSKRFIGIKSLILNKETYIKTIAKKLNKRYDFYVKCLEEEILQGL